MWKLLFYVSIVGVFLQATNGQRWDIEKMERCPCEDSVIEGFRASVAKNSLDINNGQKIRLELRQLTKDDCKANVVDESPKPGRIEISMVYHGILDIEEQGNGEDQNQSYKEQQVGGDVRQQQGMDVRQQQGMDVRQQQGMDVRQQQGMDVRQQQGMDVRQQQGMDVRQQQGMDVRQQQGMGIGQQQGMGIRQQQEDEDIGQEQEDEDMGQQQEVGALDPQKLAEYIERLLGSLDSEQVKQIMDMYNGQWQEEENIGQQQEAGGLGGAQQGMDIEQQQEDEENGSQQAMDIGQQEIADDIERLLGSLDLEQVKRFMDIKQQQEEESDGQQQRVGDIGPPQGMGIGQQQEYRDIGQKQEDGDIGQEQEDGDIGQEQEDGDIGQKQEEGAMDPQKLAEYIDRLLGSLDLEQLQQMWDIGQMQAGVQTAQEQSQLSNGSDKKGYSTKYSFTLDVSTGKLSDSTNSVARVTRRRKRELMPFKEVQFSIQFFFDEEPDSDVAAVEDQIKSLLEHKVLADYWLALTNCLLDVKP